MILRTWGTMPLSEIWQLSNLTFRQLYCKTSLWQQRGPRSDCSSRSGSTLCVCLPTLVLDVSIYMQQTASEDDIFNCIFHKQAKG